MMCCFLKVCPTSYPEIIFIRAFVFAQQISVPVMILQYLDDLFIRYRCLLKVIAHINKFCVTAVNIRQKRYDILRSIRRVKRIPELVFSKFEPENTEINIQAKMLCSRFFDKIYEICYHLAFSDWSAYGSPGTS